MLMLQIYLCGNANSENNNSNAIVFLLCVLYYVGLL